MSYKRHKYTYRKSASKLHKAVGDALRTHPVLRALRSYQEYPIPHTPYHVDWFVVDLNMAIECHGEQHDKPVAFDGDKEKAARVFEEQLKRDALKRRLCIEQGWKIIEIWYYDDLETDAIARKILASL